MSGRLSRNEVICFLPTVHFLKPFTKSNGTDNAETNALSKRAIMPMLKRKPLSLIF